MRARLVVLGLAVAMALSGCGHSDKGGDNIVLWLIEGSTPASVRDYLIQQYEIYNGGRLIINEMSAETIIQRALDSTSGGYDRPDVAEIPEYATSTLIANQALRDLTGLYRQVQGDKLNPALMELGTLNDQHYTYPYYVTARFVYYRKDIWASAGIKEVPTTLEEFDRAVASVTAANPRKIDGFSGFHLADQDWRDAVSWIYANGGDLARHGEQGWESTLSDPRSLEGLHQLQNLHTSTDRGTWGSPVDRPCTYINDLDWIYDEFGEAIETTITSASIIGDVSMQSEVGRRVRTESGARIREWDDDAFGVFALPGVGGGVAPSYLHGSSVGVLAHSSRHQGYVDLLTIIYSSEFQTMLGRIGVGPANEDYWEYLGTDEFTQAMIATVHSAKPTPAAPGWLFVEKSSILDEFFTEIMRGGDVESLAARYDERLTPLLNTPTRPR